MGKIFWSVDEKKYNDQSAHTLILSGWAADTEERKECELLFYGDGEELPALKISRHYRADVAKNLTELGKVNAGFPGGNSGNTGTCRKICRTGTLRCQWRRESQYLERTNQRTERILCRLSDGIQN